MKTLNRALLIILCVVLLAAVLGSNEEATRKIQDHVVSYVGQWRGLLEALEFSLFGILIWCVLFVKKEPTFVRIGLVAVMLAFIVLMVLHKA